MSIYPAGQGQITPLTGLEQVRVDGGGATIAYATTGQIGGLSGGGTTTDFVSTPITTVGNGTLTAAALLGGIVVRTGPVAAFTDTTAAAAAIVTLIGAFVSGATFSFIIKNATAFVETLAGGTGVTAPTTAIVGPFQEAEYFGVIGGTAAAPTVTLNHILTTSIAATISSGSPSATALATVGAGTVTAIGINGGATSRGGAQSGTAFTDTTDTAVAIIAGNPGLVNKIGTSFLYYYANTTNALATLTGGVGVTVSQGALGTTALIPQGMTAGFILTYTAAATVTMVCIGLTNNAASTMALAGSTSGQAQIAASAVAGNTVSTLPAVTGTLASTSGANLLVTDIYRCTAIQTANANVTPANITGLSGAVAVGTYEFEASIFCTVASGTGGIAINQVLTTAVLSACNFQSMGFVAAASATQVTTTATSGTALFTQAAVLLEIVIKGSFVVSTAGTFGLQMAQNTSNASNSSVNVGSTMRLTRIA